MPTQSEAKLEDKFVKQLISLQYERVSVNTESELLVNLKSQLEKHNKTSFSEAEFKRITNHLKKGNVFEKAKILRDKFALTRDDGSVDYIEFLDTDNWCQNLFQVTNQVTIEGTYKNRYDVTILINGLPLVQIELKKRGMELKKAFNQINRYQRHSFQSNSALFGYVQIFVISNGVNTKYYANNKKQSYKQTFSWADKNNKNITQLDAFTNEFLERCHISKMICKYVVLAETDKILMVLRPYQYFAAEAIIKRVTDTNKNGYIWHTTGSGKTLTSFKAAQVLMKLPQVHKVVFVVDRKDLDYQTQKEFNNFSEGSVDGTDNTRALVKQFGDDTQLIVTTIQKLNGAISRDKYIKTMEPLTDQPIVFIFDECHRSQFGETHLKINKFFKNNQMIGFTGTPIFPENAIGNKMGKRTTAELFDDCLHRYVITDAISDDNVLKFSVEYVGRYKEKENSKTYIDVDVKNIDTEELLSSNDRLNKITDYILANHNRKTHNKKFTSLMAVSSIDTLTKYYELFRSKHHDLKIATIFSYSQNEDDKDADGIYDSDGANIDEGNINLHTRDKLENYIGDYNAMFDTKFTTKDSQSYYNYYNDISRRVKRQEIDLLLVVNMFLTGFDSKMLNTLYVDKNLKYHGLIQAFSRTNRIVNETKSQGNIVCFRNLKTQTDDAIALFSNKDAKDIILMQPYEEYVELFNKAFAVLMEIAPSVNSVDTLIDEEDQLEFIKTFRELMRLKNIMTGFSDFSHNDLSMNEQLYEDYKSKYLDLYERHKHNQESQVESILDDVDFEIELVRTDEINVNYILKLLSKYRESSVAKQETMKRNVMRIIESQEQLRSKKELIEAFIDNNLSRPNESADLEQEFDSFIESEKLEELDRLCNEENLEITKINELIDSFLYDQIKPLNADIDEALKEKHPLLERTKVVSRVMKKVMSHIEKFYEF